MQAPYNKLQEVFVFSVWITMMLIAIYNVAMYGRNIPLAEDWLLVSPYTGNEPDMFDWLWAQNNEHRIPAPKLILLALLKISNGDFRAGMFLNVLLLGLLSFCMIIVARQMRAGTTSFTDAFLPIALLNLGNWENMAWSWQLGFVLPTFLTCGMLLLMLSHPYLSKPNIAGVAGISVMLLPLSGANGLIYTPFLSLWLFYCGILNLRRATDFNARFSTSVILVISALIALALSILYFVGYYSPSWYPHSPNIWATLITASKFQAMGLGPAVKKSWNLSILIVNGFILITALVSPILVLRSKGLERQRALGIFLFLINAIVLAFAMGWGRATVVPTAGFPLRYALLTVPALIIAYFIWELYELPKLRSLAQIGLLVGSLIVLPFNTKAGLEWRNWYTGVMDKVEHDILVGTPPALLAKRHGNLVHWWDEARLTSALIMLKEAGVGPFSQMKVEQPKTTYTRPASNENN